MRYAFFLFSAMVFQASSYAQKPGYDIQFKFQGLKDSTVMLGYYYGGSFYVRDTAAVNAKGMFTFAGKDALPHGVYSLVRNRIRIFEFVISDDQQFMIETSSGDYVPHTKVTGDTDNRIYFENKLFESKKFKEVEPFITTAKDSTANQEEKKEAMVAYNKVRQEVLDHHADIISTYPKSMTARLLKIGQPLKIPDPPVRSDGSVDSTFQLRWYREHFFDNFDLSDDALLRLPHPVYTEKVSEYLDKLFVPEADTIIRAIEWMVAKARTNHMTYNYLVRECIFKYQDPNVMGLDKIFVHITDKYITTGEMNSWANEKLRKSLKEQADRLRKSMIGNQGANLIMQDADLKLRSMYDLKNRYTVIYFFDPDCGHCKRETPKLLNFYNNNKIKFNLEVFAVSADTSMGRMRDYIREMNLNWVTVNGPRSAVGSYHNLYDATTTPTIYILDERKKIIAKKLPAERLEEFLINFEKSARRKEG